MDAAGFLNDTWRDLISLIAVAGVVITVVALVVAINQLVRTRGSAEAARKAALSARDSLSFNIRLSDLTSANRRVSEIRNLLLAEQYRLAGMLLSDLRALIVQIDATRPADADGAADFQSSIAQLSTLETELVRQERDPRRPIDVVRASKRLLEVSDLLAKSVASARLEM